MLIKAEIAKIEKFIREYVQDDETVVVPVSGGLDSDRSEEHTSEL